MPIEYPEMTVEKREVNNLHGLNPPLEIGSKQDIEETQDALILSTSKDENVINTILENYSPVKTIKRPLELISELEVYPLNIPYTWDIMKDFVKQDECVEFIVLLTRWAKKRGYQPIKEVKEKDFIEGQGFGHYRRYIGRTVNCIQKVFDAKYTSKQKRILEVLKDQTGIDFSHVVGLVHPGHYSDPAGHGAKFLEASEIIIDTYGLKGIDRLDCIQIGMGSSHARSGILVHRLSENTRSGYYTNIKEFKQYGK